MNVRALVMSALMSLCLVGQVLADDVTITHEEAGFCFDVPDTWSRKVDEDDPDLLIVTSPESEIVLQSWVIEAKDIEDAVDGLADGLDEEFDDVKLDDESKEATINGLDRLTLHGTAKLDGEKVLLGITILIAEKPVIFLAIGSPEAVEHHDKVLDKISNSIRKAE